MPFKISLIKSKIASLYIKYFKAKIKANHAHYIIQCNDGFTTNGSAVFEQLLTIDEAKNKITDIGLSNKLNDGTSSHNKRVKIKPDNIIFTRWFIR